MTFENALAPDWNYKMRLGFALDYLTHSIEAVWESIKRFVGSAKHQRMAVKGCKKTLQL